MSLSDVEPDPRLTLARGDLACAMLQGVVAAERYITPEAMQACAPSAAIRREANASSEQLDQLLFGERFDVLEWLGGFAFGQARRDGYVGFVEAGALAAVGPGPTHRVRALRTFAFAEPSIKARPLGALSMNGLVAVDEHQGRLAHINGLGWVVANHLGEFGDWEADPAAVAERYLGAPYLWGGRDSVGLDCSGVVQQAMYACGHAAPRDSDMQKTLGVEITPGANLSGLMRNDLVFWRGHVGIMLDAERLLHANAHHMAVAVEPLAEAVARTRAAGSGEPAAFRRLERHAS